MTDFNVVFPYDVIIAHGPGCNDGATAAWSVWRILPQYYREKLAVHGGFYSKPSRDDDNISDGFFIHPNSPLGAISLQEQGCPVVFVFIQPSEGVPDKLVRDKRVLILDLDMGDALVPVVKAASLTLLSDHHDSTPKTLCKHSQVLFDECRHKFATYVNTNIKECGATLAWRLTHSADIPPLVKIVRIGDTWQWDDDRNAKPILTALFMKRSLRSFPDIEDTFINWNNNYDDYISKGKAVLKYERSITRQMAKSCELGYIQLINGNVYNVAYTQATVLRSEVGSSIRYYAEKRFRVPIHFCCTWSYVPYKNLVSVSLRDSIPGLNLAAIARNIKGTNGKGGGHAAAAGFSFSSIENFHYYIKSTPPASPVNQNLFYYEDFNMFDPHPEESNTSSEPTPCKTNISSEPTPCESNTSSETTPCESNTSSEPTPCESNTSSETTP